MQLGSTCPLTMGVSNMRETIYSQRANGTTEYVTYCDGQTVYLSEKRAKELIKRHNFRLVQA